MARTPPPRARLVRRAPLVDRIKAHLNLWDLLLWLSEELNSSELEDALQAWATPLGLALNLVFIVSRANTSPSSRASDDVFGDSRHNGSGWLTWLATLTSTALVILSLANAFYTFTRKRTYRLFEAPLNDTPNTPSARRVRVADSPSHSPLRRLISNVLPPSASSRTHPDSHRDVWELAIWDPTPYSLRLFTLFSPGHVLIYWLFFPLRPLEPRPSVTIATAIFLSLLLSAQLAFLQHAFTRQAKDNALVSRHVLNEYDTKFVYPNIRKAVRDVGTQVTSKSTLAGTREVLTYTPTTYVNRGFQVNPNTNYAAHYDPDGVSDVRPRPAATAKVTPRSVTSPNLLSSTTPMGVNAHTAFSSPMRPGTTPSGMPRQRHAAAGDGGSFGVYSHAHSPLSRGAEDRRRAGSPLKRASQFSVFE